ncbi:MAG: carbon dioxide transporter, partial [Leptolyngbya sp. LCM1.Bin17]
MTHTLPKATAPHPLDPFIQRLLSAEALLPDSDTNVLEVVGILKSYGV